jgi:BolA protein
VNEALAEELAGDVHALALHTYTPEEWQARFGDAPMSPPCLGGKAAEGGAS